MSLRKLGTKSKTTNHYRRSLTVFSLCTITSVQFKVFPTFYIVLLESVGSDELNLSVRRLFVERNTNHLAFKRSASESTISLSRNALRATVRAC